MLGLVPGCISFSRFFLISVLSPFSLFMASKFTIFSPFNGSPELIFAIGKSLHLVSLRLSELLPLNTFTSILSSYTLLSLDGSPV